MFLFLQSPLSFPPAFPRFSLIVWISFPPLLYFLSYISFLSCFSFPPKAIVLLVLFPVFAATSGNQYDFLQYTNIWKEYFSDCILHPCVSNNKLTTDSIEQQAERLVDEVKTFLINSPRRVGRVSFLCHSMGNIVLRCALQDSYFSEDLFLQRRLLHTFVSLSGPHLGVQFSDSFLVDSATRLVAFFGSVTSLRQLLLQDASNLRETLLYRLSQHPGLSWFRHIVFVSSEQDLYVPHYSSRVVPSPSSLVDVSDRSRVLFEMAHSIFANLSSPNPLGWIPRLVRCFVRFHLPSSLQSYVGRAAHVAFLMHKPFVKLFILHFRYLFSMD